MSFQLHALSPEPFQHYFAMDDATLRQHRAKRVKASSKPGFPCRISLEDAEIGEEVILCPYEHLPADSPYASQYAIYVRQGVSAARPARGELPPVLENRPIALRGFDKDQMLIAALLGKGEMLGDLINQMFHNQEVAYIHLHNAMHGCFAAKVTR